jgi:hypothetical protein
MQVMIFDDELWHVIVGPWSLTHLQELNKLGREIQGQNKKISENRYR